VGNQYYAFEQFVADVNKIAKTVEASGRKFKKIWGPPRGGLPLAVCLSHRLNLEFLQKDPVSEACTTSGFGVELLDIKSHEKLRRSTLIVDDIADTGKTLKEFKDDGFYIATLFKHPQSSFTPDIWLHEKGSDWIVFWWESLGSLTCKHLPPT